MRYIVQRCFKSSIPLMLCAVLTLGGAAAQSPKGVSLPKPASPVVPDYDAVRYLEQATFGPNRPLINRVQTTGIKDVLQDEFAVPMSLYPDLPVFPADSS